MSYFYEARPILEKVLKVIAGDKDLLESLPKLFYPYKGMNEGILNAEGLADLAGNHLFDDCYELFGITKDDGHKIRGYFGNCLNYEYVIDLHEAFDEYIDPERKDFLYHINKHRIQEGLDPILL